MDHLCLSVRELTFIRYIQAFHGDVEGLFWNTAIKQITHIFFSSRSHKEILYYTIGYKFSSIISFLKRTWTGEMIQQFRCLLENIYMNSEV